MSRNRGVLVGIASFALLLWPACGSTDPTPPAPASTQAPEEPTATPTPALSPFEQEWEALKAAARAEGKLVVATGSTVSRGIVPVFRGVFGEEFGIQVVINGGNGGQHIGRITAERAGGRYELDAIIHSRTTLGQLGPAGVLAPIQEQIIHPDALDLSKWFGGRLWWREPDGVEPKFSISTAVRALPNPIDPGYNSDLLTEADIAEIDSVWDFLDERWKGQIIAMSPLEGGTASRLQLIYQHEGMGPEWLARFYGADLDVTFVADDRQIVDAIALGTHTFSILDVGAGSVYPFLKLQGMPVDVWSKNLKEGGIMAASGAGSWTALLDRAPHPNAAKLWLNWWLTQEGQTAYNTLIEGGSQAPSLREDVPPGVTLPQQRRVPGAVYAMASLDTSLPDRTLEAVEFAQRAFLER